MVVGHALQGAAWGVGRVVSWPFRVKFALFYLLAVLFILFNANAFDPRANVVTTVSIYVAALAFGFVITGERNPFLEVSTGEFLFWFGASIAFGAFLFTVVEPFSPAQPLLTSESVLLLAVHAFVVAIGEEMLFRHLIPSLLPAPAVVAQLVSAVFFGLMHYSAYGGDHGAMYFAIAFGALLGLIVAFYPRVGLFIVMGLHLTWNAATQGFVA